MLKSLLDRFVSRDSKSHKREVASKSFLNLIARIGGRGLNYLLIFLIIRIYGNEDFGKWVLVSTLFLVSQLVSNMGLKVASVRYFAEYQNKTLNLINFYQKSAIALLVSSLTIIAILHFAAALFNSIYEKEYLAEFIRVIAWGILPLNFIELHAGILRGLRKIGLFSFLDSFSKPLFFIVLLLIGSYFERAFSNLFLLYTVSLFAISILSFVFVLTQFSKLKETLLTGHKTSFRQLFSVSLPMLLTASLDMVNRWADIIILGFFCNDFLIGAYGLAVRLSSVISMSLQAVNSISASKIRELYVAKNIAALKQVVHQSGKIMFWFGMIPALILMPAGSFVLSLFDPMYEVALWSLIILSFAQLINVFAGSTFPLLNMTGSHTKLMQISLVSAVLNVLLNFWLIPLYGIIGAALATAAATVLNNLLCVLTIYKRLGFSPFYIPFRP